MVLSYTMGLVKSKDRSTDMLVDNEFFVGEGNDSLFPSRVYLAIKHRAVSRKFTEAKDKRIAVKKNRKVRSTLNS